MPYVIGPYGPAGLEPGTDAQVMREGHALLERCRRAMVPEFDADPWFSGALTAAGRALEVGTRAALRDAGDRTRSNRSASLADRITDARDAPLIALRHLHAWLWAYGRVPGSGRFSCRTCGQISMPRLSVETFCWTCGWRHSAFGTSSERRANGITAREARRRFEQTGAVTEDRREVLRAPFLCELPDDPRSRKWIVVDVGELAALRDRLSRLTRAARKQSHAVSLDPTPWLHTAVCNLWAHEVWSGVGQFELLQYLNQRDESSAAYRELAATCEEYLRALGQRLSQLPTYSCDACDAPTLHSPGYPCRHCGWFAGDEDLDRARRDIARYGRVSRRRVGTLRPLYSFERSEARSPIKVDRPLAACLDALARPLPTQRD